MGQWRSEDIKLDMLPALTLKRLLCVIAAIKPCGSLVASQLRTLTLGSVSEFSGKSFRCDDASIAMFSDFFVQSSLIREF